VPRLRALLGVPLALLLGGALAACAGGGGAAGVYAGAPSLDAPTAARLFLDWCLLQPGNAPAPGLRATRANLEPLAEPVRRALLGERFPGRAWWLAEGGGRAALLVWDRGSCGLELAGEPGPLDDAAQAALRARGIEPLRVARPEDGGIADIRAYMVPMGEVLPTSPAATPAATAAAGAPVPQWRWMGIFPLRQAEGETLVRILALPPGIIVPVQREDEEPFRTARGTEAQRRALARTPARAAPRRPARMR